MIASAQFTIISLCDVVTSDTPPENPYEGQLWVDTSVTPPETKIWDGNEWVVQNDIETIRTTISILTEKDAQFQQTIDGLNSYVATFIDNSDPLQIIVTSTGGDVFKNGQGTTVLTAVCYQAGSEVDAAGNGSYTWTKYNKDGVVDTSWGTNGSKTGKSLSVSSADVDTKATFMVVVALYGTHTVRICDR